MKSTDSAESRDLMFMQSPDDWPRWPILPVKHYEPGQNWPVTGIIIDNGRPEVYLDVNIFGTSEEFRDSLKAAKRETYDSFDAMVVAGWRVD